MPPLVTTTPKWLKPYVFHGMELSIRGKEAVATCPWCDKEGKFSILIETGQWRCLYCNEGSENSKVTKGGNATTFLRKLWEMSDKATSDYSEIAEHRGLAHPETAMHWGACKSILTGEWLVPGYNPDGVLIQLYRYASLPNGKNILMATPEFGHGMFGVKLFDPKKKSVYLCEGPWDGMAAWETMRCAKVGGDGRMVLTGAESSSLLADANVLAVPGCNVFFEAWMPLFGSKRVTLMYDNDHPRTNPKTNATIPPPGLEGVKRVSAVMAKSVEYHPEELSFLCWGKDGYDPELPPGYDLRDVVKAADTMPERITRIESVLSRITPVPSEWVPGRAATATNGSVESSLLHCEDWSELTNWWRKAMKWTEGLDRGFSVMLASIISTRAVGDQLWVMVMGPASCGKSVLCEALSMNKEYVLAKSTIRGFHSGFQVDREGKVDSSLIAQAKDKTLVTKDGDTLLQSPNLGQILAEARDVYDRVSRTHYRNQTSRVYENVNMTWILCGTGSLRGLDTSELGERFLKCCISKDMSEELEREISWRVALRAERELSLQTDGTTDGMDGPEMLKAKQLTGGYIRYLRRNAQTLLDKVHAPEWALRKCVDVAEFVAFMRARPSKKQDERAEREMSFRLVSQHVRLAKCLAAVLGKTEIDEEVMRRVIQVGIDTADGKVVDLVKVLIEDGERGTDYRSLAIRAHQSDEDCLHMLKYMRKIKVVEHFHTVAIVGVKSQPRWRVTPRLRRLYEEVVGFEGVVVNG